jgi:Fe-S cluster biogenesis protein NfuA
MLTADFIYLESCDSKSMEDLELFSLSELDDYFSQPLIQQTADEDQPELKIKLLIKTIIAPYLQRDGGNLELISYDAEIVKIHFLGKCQGCPYAAQTLKNHVEKNLIHYLPQIKEVLLA